LLRKHAHLKAQRLGISSSSQKPLQIDSSQSPSVLQPIIDVLQYQVFCDRVKAEIDQAVSALATVGIPSKMRFNAVGETGDQLVQMLLLNTSKSIGGQAVLKIDNRFVSRIYVQRSITHKLSRHIIRLTFLSPSSLTAHLSQATLAISSLPQLRQLLSDEVERCLLQKICNIGTQLCEHVGGTWFVDLNKCVGRWEGCVLYAHSTQSAISMSNTYITGIFASSIAKRSQLIALCFSSTRQHLSVVALIHTLQIKEDFPYYPGLKKS
jgi:mediator of RNA polymerase II transcription subunit 17